MNNQELISGSLVFGHDSEEYPEVLASGKEDTKLNETEHVPSNGNKSQELKHNRPTNGALIDQRDTPVHVEEEEEENLQGMDPQFLIHSRSLI